MVANKLGKIDVDRLQASLVAIFKDVALIVIQDTSQEH